MMSLLDASSLYRCGLYSLIKKKSIHWNKAPAKVGLLVRKWLDTGKTVLCIHAKIIVLGQLYEDNKLSTYQVLIKLIHEKVIKKTAKKTSENK